MTDITFDVLEKVQDTDKIENGAWVDLDNPTNDEPLFADAPKNERRCRALVRSAKSTRYRAKDFNIQTRAMGKSRRARASEQDKILEIEMASERPKKFAVLLAALDNCDSKHPGVKTLSEAEALELAGKPNLQWLVDQVMSAAFKDEPYGITEAGSGNAPAPADDA